MKKNWAWIFLCICIAIGVACGVMFGIGGRSSESDVQAEQSAANLEENTEYTQDASDSTSTKNDTKKDTQPVAEKNIVSPSSDEDIAEAMNDAASFAWNWLWDNQYCDEEQAIDEGNIKYCPITESEIQSQEDLKKLTQQYFTSDVAAEMVDELPWLERDDGLYAPKTGDSGGGYPTECVLWIEKQSDEQYNIIVKENVLDESYTMHYKLENGNWVFDKSLLWPKDISIEIQTTDTASQKDDADSGAEDAGSCGDDLYWTYRNGTLTISGTGKMDIYPESPWASHIDEIQKVVVEEGCTSITRGVFWGYEKIKEIQLPQSLLYIERSAFADCTALKNVEITASLKGIGMTVFGGCSSLQTITFTGNAPEFVETGSGNFGIDEDDPITIYYPAGNATWTDEVKSQLSGNNSDITWKEQ